MSFDRHEILKAHYKKEIEGWSWDEIAKRFDRNAKDEDCYEIDDCSNDKYVCLYIGSVVSCVPSGKLYAFWTTNQTRSDVTRDAAWWEALEEVCEAHDCGVSSPDGCSGDDIFLCKRYDVEEEDEDARDEAA